MNRPDAYKILTARLEQTRRLGYSALLARINQPPSSESIPLATENILVEIRILWHDHKKQSLRIEASALGPSTWTMQRLDERLIVHPAQEPSICPPAS